MFWLAGHAKRGKKEVLTEAESYIDFSLDFETIFFYDFQDSEEVEVFANNYSLDLKDYGFLRPNKSGLGTYTVDAQIALRAFKKLMEIEEIERTPTSVRTPKFFKELDNILKFLERTAEHDYRISGGWI